MHNVDFSFSTVYEADFSKGSLKNAKFDGGSCYYCNFEGIDITEIKISKDLPANTNFAGSSFRNIDFRDWEVGAVDFSVKNILILGCTGQEYAAIPQADLTGANFSGMDLKDITFARNNNPGIAWNDVNFSFADLSFHDLRNMSLKNANFSNADLTGVDFTNVDLENANFSNAILDDAILDCYNHEICN